MMSRFTGSTPSDLHSETFSWSSAEVGSAEWPTELEGHPSLECGEGQ